MTSETVRITDLFIYPIKSCAGIRVDQLVFDDIGPVGDRRYMIVAPSGKFLSQRQLPEMAHILPELTELGLRLTFSRNPDLETCDVVFPDNSGLTLDALVWGDTVPALDCGDDVAIWLEKALGRPARLVFMADGTRRQVDQDYADASDWVSFADGFPLLVTHQSSLDFLSSCVERDIGMIRFRPNVVVAGGKAFDELTWSRLQHCSEPEVSMNLAKPCTRCVIPTRNPDSLERELDVLEALKQHCRIEKQILFGQNALVRNVDTVCVGSEWSIGR